MPGDLTNLPRRGLLPYDVAVTPRAPLGDLFKVGKAPTPPTYNEVADPGLIAPEEDPDRWFSPEEKLTAAWLRGRGSMVRGAGASPGLAESALVAALRMYGSHLDEVVLIVTNDLSVGWSHG